jgi:hypothetical protein
MSVSGYRNFQRNIALLNIVALARAIHVSPARLLELLTELRLFFLRASAAGEHNSFFTRSIPIREECRKLLHNLVENFRLLPRHAKIRALRTPQNAETRQFGPRHPVPPRNHGRNSLDDSKLDAKLVSQELFTLTDEL